MECFDWSIKSIWHNISRSIFKLMHSIISVSYGERVNLFVRTTKLYRDR